jgi:hypothetical protein
MECLLVVPPALAAISVVTAVVSATLGWTGPGLRCRSAAFNARLRVALGIVSASTLPGSPSQRILRRIRSRPQRVRWLIWRCPRRGLRSAGCLNPRSGRWLMLFGAGTCRSHLILWLSWGSRRTWPLLRAATTGVVSGVLVATISCVPFHIGDQWLLGRRNRRRMLNHGMPLVDFLSDNVDGARRRLQLRPVNSQLATSSTARCGDGDRGCRNIVDGHLSDFGMSGGPDLFWANALVNHCVVVYDVVVDDRRMIVDFGDFGRWKAMVGIIMVVEIANGDECEMVRPQPKVEAGRDRYSVEPVAQMHIEISVRR